MMLKRFDPFFDFEFPTSFQSRSRFLEADVYVRGDIYYIEIDAPGVSLEDIDVEVERNHLTVSVERREMADNERTEVVRGRAMGRFSRRFYLSESLDGSSVEAGYENGILTLSIPVTEKAKARKIEIQAGAAELEA